MHNSLPSQILKSNLSIGSRHLLPRGMGLVDGIGRNGDEFVLVESGAILQYATSSSGERLYLSIISTGYVFTPQSIAQLICNDQFGADVIRDVSIRRIPRSQWEAINREHHELYSWVIEQEAQQLQIVHFHLAQHLKRNSLDRARFALCAYAQGLGLEHPCGSKTIRVSRAELASWIGVSSDRMCRLIRSLHESGEVTVAGRSIKVSLTLMSSLRPRLT